MRKVTGALHAGPFEVDFSMRNMHNDFITIQVTMMKWIVLLAILGFSGLAGLIALTFSLL